MAHAIRPTAAIQRPAEPGDLCLGRTCLQWRADGELAEPDAALVIARLRAVDPLLEALLSRSDPATG